MGFAAVVFDLDGVLVESEHLWEENWVAYAAAYGVEWTAADTATVQGMSAPEWAAYLAERSGTPETPEQVEKAVVDGMIKSIADGEAPLLDGADAMVRDVAARVPVALASSAARRVIDAVLETHGLTGEFSATVSSAEVPRGKPSPDVYAEAASRLGFRGEECLGVEDSSNGIRAAAAAGLTVIALPNPAYPPKPDALELAAQVAESNHDVRKLLLAYLAGELVRS
ncbi:HAD family hydrolase [Amycolatopsis methanolica]|uniref:HAD-superfamily hydrolase, subfamily IA, variant 3 n=1 Tax=Amycolatopsis methanolica 239 TaxID=1068978 RepID=A0A076N1C8_AMYME|nr:HAD family phosphatase [Amycolatopsis methanolica]AIJ26618.1 HAD-superfamily hydrolase, subfamily IA, variant 3 [Amycolatopsis methanolica 239]